VPFFVFRCESHNTVVVGGTPYRCPICDNLFCGEHKLDVLKCNHVKYVSPDAEVTEKAQDIDEPSDIEDEEEDNFYGFDD
jgi:hypothetical protein